MTLFGGHKRLNLALQGGGAHGAFTWGVLDRLLERDDLTVGWLSGTSAGAVNAVAVAAGMLAATGSDAAEGARAMLAKVWRAVQSAGVPDLVRLNPFLYGMTKASGMTSLTNLLSPYEFNPLGFDPLRKLLTEHIDFDALRRQAGPELLIAATDVATGQPRLFRRAEISVEAVLASACLPQIHHAVEIDGRTYWDGGFSANPDLVTVATESGTPDTLLVELNPFERAETPRSARGIAAHISTLTFNQPLRRDIELIVTAQDHCNGGTLGRLFGRRDSRLTRLGQHRFHLITAGRYTARLSAESKGMPERSLLSYLFDSGRMEAGRWLDRHLTDVGRRQSVDLRARYLDRPRPTPPAADGDAATFEDQAELAMLGTRI